MIIEIPAKDILEQVKINLPKEFQKQGKQIIVEKTEWTTEGIKVWIIDK